MGRKTGNQTVILLSMVAIITLFLIVYLVSLYINSKKDKAPVNPSVVKNQEENRTEKTSEDYDKRKKDIEEQQKKIDERFEDAEKRRNEVQEKSRTQIADVINGVKQNNNSNNNNPANNNNNNNNVPSNEALQKQADSQKERNQKKQQQLKKNITSNSILQAFKINLKIGNQQTQQASLTQIANKIINNKQVATEQDIKDYFTQIGAQLDLQNKDYYSSSTKFDSYFYNTFQSHLDIIVGCGRKSKDKDRLEINNTIVQSLDDLLLGIIRDSTGNQIPASTEIAKNFEQNFSLQKIVIEPMEQKKELIQIKQQHNIVKTIVETLEDSLGIMESDLGLNSYCRHCPRRLSVFNGKFDNTVAPPKNKDQEDYIDLVQKLEQYKFGVNTINKTDITKQPSLSLKLVEEKIKQYQIKLCGINRIYKNINNRGTFSPPSKIDDKLSGFNYRELLQIRAPGNRFEMSCLWVLYDLFDAKLSVAQNITNQFWEVNQIGCQTLTSAAANQPLEGQLGSMLQRQSGNKQVDILLFEELLTKCLAIPQFLELVDNDADFFKLYLTKSLVNDDYSYSFPILYENFGSGKQVKYHNTANFLHTRMFTFFMKFQVLMKDSVFWNTLNQLINKEIELDKLGLVSASELFGELSAGRQAYVDCVDRLVQVKKIVESSSGSGASANTSFTVKDFLDEFDGKTLNQTQPAPQPTQPTQPTQPAQPNQPPQSPQSPQPSQSAQPTYANPQAYKFLQDEIVSGLEAQPESDFVGLSFFSITRNQDCFKDLNKEFQDLKKNLKDNDDGKPIELVQQDFNQLEQKSQECIDNITNLLTQIPLESMLTQMVSRTPEAIYNCYKESFWKESLNIYQTVDQLSLEHLNTAENVDQLQNIHSRKISQYLCFFNTLFKSFYLNENQISYEDLNEEQKTTAETMVKHIYEKFDKRTSTTITTTAAPTDTNISVGRYLHQIFNKDNETFQDCSKFFVKKGYVEFLEAIERASNTQLTAKKIDIDSEILQIFMDNFAHIVCWDKLDLNFQHFCPESVMRQGYEPIRNFISDFTSYGFQLDYYRHLSKANFDQRLLPFDVRINHKYFYRYQGATAITGFTTQQAYLDKFWTTTSSNNSLLGHKFTCEKMNNKTQHQADIVREIKDAYNAVLVVPNDLGKKLTNISESAAVVIQPHSLSQSAIVAFSTTQKIFIHCRNILMSTVIFFIDNIKKHKTQFFKFQNQALFNEIKAYHDSILLSNASLVGYDNADYQNITFGLRMIQDDWYFQNLPTAQLRYQTCPFAKFNYTNITDLFNENTQEIILQTFLFDHFVERILQISKSSDLINRTKEMLIKNYDKNSSGDSNDQNNPNRPKLETQKKNFVELMSLDLIEESSLSKIIDAVEFECFWENRNAIPLAPNPDVNLFNSRIRINQIIQQLKLLQKMKLNHHFTMMFPEEFEHIKNKVDLADAAITTMFPTGLVNNISLEPHLEQYCLKRNDVNHQYYIYHLGKQDPASPNLIQAAFNNFLPPETQEINEDSLCYHNFVINALQNSNVLDFAKEFSDIYKDAMILRQSGEVFNLMTERSKINTVDQPPNNQPNNTKLQKLTSILGSASDDQVAVNFYTSTFFNTIGAKFSNTNIRPIQKMTFSIAYPFQYDNLNYKFGDFAIQFNIAAGDQMQLQDKRIQNIITLIIFYSLARSFTSEVGVDKLDRFFEMQLIILRESYSTKTTVPPPNTYVANKDAKAVFLDGATFSSQFKKVMKNTDKIKIETEFIDNKTVDKYENIKHFEFLQMIRNSMKKIDVSLNQKNWNEKQNRLVYDSVIFNELKNIITLTS